MQDARFMMQDSKRKEIEAIRIWSAEFTEQRA
jgi:hypothetical protein